MALRSLGSSLLAKTQPGSVSRKQREERILKPEIPGKGGIGSLERGLVEEPFVRPVPPGSEKIVSVTPAIEALSQPGAPIPSQPNLMPGLMGQAPVSAPGQTRPGADAQALFQSMVQAAPSITSAAAPTTKGRTAAQARSGGALANAGMATAYQPLPTESVNVQAPQPSPSPSANMPSAAQLSGGAALGTGGAAKGKNVVSQVGNVLRSAMAAATPIVNRALGSLEGARGGGAAFMMPNPFYNQSKTPIQNIQQSPAGNILRSVFQAASNVGNNLRSALSKIKLW